MIIIVTWYRRNEANKFEKEKRTTNTKHNNMKGKKNVNSKRNNHMAIWITTCVDMYLFTKWYERDFMAHIFPTHNSTYSMIRYGWVRKFFFCICFIILYI